MSFTIELVVMIASIMMTCIILIHVIGFRRERGVTYLIGVIVFRIIYSSGVVLEKASYEFADKLIFRNIHQTALNLIVPLFLLFTLELVGRDRLLGPLWKLWLFLLFALWSMLMWFNSDLQIIYHRIELLEGQLVTDKTMYSTTFSIICYIIIAICFYLLFQYMRNIRDDLRKPVMWVLFLSSFTLVFEILRLLNPAWSSWLLSLSVYCGFIGMVMLAIVLRSKFLSIVPFARNMVLDTLQESILIANASGHIIDNNKQASDWFAKLGQSVISGRPIGELLTPWPEWKLLCDSMEQGNVEIEASFDGERRMYSVNVYPFHTQRKQRQAIISIIFDITEKQRNLEQIVQLSQLKDQFVTIISHDIRAPLAMQHQLVGALEEDKISFQSDHRDIIEKLSEQTRQTLGMTNNLLEWFRSQREDMVLLSSVVVLVEAAEECCQALHSQSEAKQIKVNNDISDGMLVYADREALGLILRNLLSNAIKFTGLGGTIEVSARVSDNMVVISVRDHGVGMEEERVRQFLDKKQLNSSIGTSGKKGAGLGLLVSRQFVERSGGELWVDSKLGEGTVFHFTMRGGFDSESVNRG